MKQSTITGTTDVWYTQENWLPLGNIRESENEDYIVNQLSFSASDMSQTENWIKIGKAKITVTFDGDDTVITQQIKSLNLQLTTTRAENHIREKRLIDQISDLLALPLQPTTKEL